MKTVLDAHMLGEHEGGNETYVAGLLQGFASTPLCNEVAITPVYNTVYQPEQDAESRLHGMRLKHRGNIQRLGVELPRICRRVGASVVHVTYNAPFFSPCPSVVTVHDVIFRRYPHYFSPRVRLLLRTLMPWSMHKAAVILTGSEDARHEIVHYYPFVRDKIMVTLDAAGTLVKAVPDPQAVQQHVGQGSFILAVGTVQPRKNIVRLIQAYIRLRDRGETTAKLVIVGRAQWQHSEIHRLAANSMYTNDILFPGYLPDATVAALYNGCAVFVYPSLYEGFGLPVLEAMTCGAPVITSKTSSLPEVAGSAAILIDPFSVEEIASAIASVVNNASIREDLRVRGRQQAARFSWERTAEATYEAYKWAVTHSRKPST